MNRPEDRKSLEIIDKFDFMVTIEPVAFWISGARLTVSAKLSMKWFLTLSLGLSLGFALSACGGKKSMEGAGEEEQVASTVSSEDKVTRLAGEEEGTAQASFDEADKARRLAALPSGSTASGHGKKETVIVKAGDTLWKIAERKDVYGSGWLYPLIYKANKGLIKDPNRLEAGVKLKIPRDVPSVEAEIAKEDAMTGQILDQSPLPGAKPTATPAKALTATKVAGKSGGKGWLWFLLLALVGALLFFWRRMKQDEASSESAA